MATQRVILGGDFGRRWSAVILGMALLLLIPAGAYAANPYLAKDINTVAATGSSSPANLAAFNGALYFAATTTTHGAELWKSDGTSAGTVLFKDINPGPSSSSPANFIVIGTTLFFTATDGSNGTELWKSDGTAAGTVMIREISVIPGSGSSPSNLTAFGTTLYFTANDGATGTELWKSDGTAAGTVMVMDINPGSGSSSPAYLTVFGSYLYFRATDGMNGYELWRTNGTTTSLFEDINPDANSSYPAYLTVFGSYLYFQATDGTNGYELWRTNGTTTTLFKDINPGAGGSYPAHVTVFGSYLYFQATDGTNGYEVWRTDGTATILVADINAGAGSSSPVNFTVLGSYLYFQATDGTNGYELWRTNGTTTSLFANINPGAASSSPAELTVFGSYLYFRADDGTNGVELWRTNGTTTSLFANINTTTGAGSTPTDFTVLGSYLYFKATDATYGAELWRTDNTTTSLVKDINFTNGTGSSSPSNLLVVGSLVYFTANDGVNGTELWKYNGTTATLIDVNPGSGSSYPAYLTAIGTTIYFQAYHPSYGYELWKYDGANLSVIDINGGTGNSNPANLTVMGTTLYYSAYHPTYGTELRKYNGTTESLVMDMNPGTASSSPGNLSVYGTTDLLFSATTVTYGTELWRSTSGGSTFLAKDINPGTASSSPSYFEWISATLYFRADDGTNGAELWKSNGTSGTTLLVSDIYPGSSGSYPAYLTAVGTTLYFQATDGANGYELWKSDGTDTGTMQMKDIYPGVNSSYPANLTVLGSALYFQANDGTNGYELWKADGTPLGTIMVEDIYPGPGNSSPAYLTVFGSHLYFQANDGKHGAELWRSDGTASGTILAGEVVPGATSGYPVSLAAMGTSLLYFRATDPVYGDELHAFNPAYPAGTIATSTGSDYVTGTSVTLNLTCMDTGGSCTQMQFSTDNVTWSAAEPFATTRSWTLPSGDGPKTVYVRFQDSSGNWSSSYVLRMVLDTTVPETYIVLAPPSRTGATATTFGFASLESATFECRLDEDPAGFQPCANPWVKNLYGGTHILQVRAVDLAGHADPTPVTYSWTIIDTLDGVAYGWGRNAHGAIGSGSRDEVAHPVIEQVPSPINFIQISAGQWHSIALRNDGTVWGWGNNYNSQIGNPAYAHQFVLQPVQAAGLTEITSIAAGYDINLALKADGTVWHWGSYIDNSQNPLLEIAAPAQVTGLTGVTAVAAGGNHVLALRSNGTVWAWGQDNNGELGQGVAGGAFQPTPVPVPGLTGIIAIRASSSTSYALKSDGTVWAWGYGGSGALGNGGNADSSTPVQVSTATGMANITALATGGFGSHMFAIDASGYAWGWGPNTFGQLGLGAGQYGNSYNTPQKVTLLPNIIAVSAGGNHTLFLTLSNTAWSAGMNYFGQLGQGLYDSRYDHSIPEMVGYLNGAFSVAAGGEHSLALASKWITADNDVGGGSAGRKSSIVLDKNDNPHIGYVEYWTQVRYRSSTSGAWNAVEVVDNGLVELSAVSLVLDAGGKAHLCYQGKNSSTGNYEVRYATNSAGRWDVTTLATDAVPGGSYYNSDSLGCDIAYYRSKVSSLYVSYFTQNTASKCGTLKLARKQGTAAWEHFTVDDGCPAVNSYIGTQNSLMVDATNTVHIAYKANALLKYARGNATSWTLSTIDSTSQEYFPSIALNPSTQYPAISYAETYSCGPMTCYKVKYAEAGAGGWSLGNVDNYNNRSVGENGTSLAFSASGTPYIAYYEKTNDDLRVAIGGASRSVWRLTAVDTTNSVGSWPSIAVDSLNAAHISYFYHTMGQAWGMKYATNSDSDVPAGTIQINGTAAYATSTDVTLNLTCSDGLGIGCWQMRLSNTAAFDAEPLETFTVTRRNWILNSTNGYQNVYVKFKDSANNWSNVASDMIFLDTVKPTGTLTINAAGGYTQNPMVQLSTSCSDAGGSAASGCSTMKFSTDGSLYSPAAKYTTQSSAFLPPGDGVKTVYAVYTDAAGNESVPVSQNVTLDQTPPAEWNVVINTGQMTTNNRAVSLTLSCADALSGCNGYQISNDSVSWSSFFTLTTYPSMTGWELAGIEGPNTVFVRYRDRAGNVTAERQATITLDTSQPAGLVLINGDQPYTTSANVTLSLVCDDAGTGCTQMRFSSNGIIWADPVSFATATGYTLMDGPATLWSWGLNDVGQLGNGTVGSPANNRNAPTDTVSGSEWVAVSASPAGSTVYAIKYDGTLWAWGKNDYGQLGIGTSGSPANDKSVPTQVGTDTQWIAVASGMSHALALKADGTLWTWGYNGFGQLGLGNYTPYTTPQQVAGTWTAVAAGAYHSLGIKADGTLWTWGYNYYGQLGLGSTLNQTTPQQVAGTWTSITAGYYHSLGIKSGGSLFAWGYNHYGQLGIGTSGSPANDKNTPQQIAGTWSAAAGGYYHSLAIKADGSLWSWGYNGSGQLGIGSYAQQTTPQAVAAGAVWASLSAGGFHSAGIKADGTLWTWGSNSYGQLGCGTACGADWLPQQITAGSRYRAVSGGYYHTAAMPVADAKYVFVKYLDSVGNWSPSFHDSILLDTAPPAGTISINSSAPATTSTSVMLTLSCLDSTSACAQMRFSNDNISWSALGPYAPSAPWALSAGEGVKTVYVRFTDGAGRETSTNITDTIIYDVTVPAGSVMINAGAPYALSTSVTLTVSASDTNGVTQMQFSNDGAAWSAAEPYQTAAPRSWALAAGDGAKTVYARFQDGTGLWSGPSTTITDAINLDTTPPTGSVTISSGAPYTLSTSVTLTVSASDTNGVTQMQFSNDGATWSTPVTYTTATAWTLAAGADGARIVYARFRDTGGNWSTAFISDTISLDTAAPSGSLQVNANAVSTTDPSVTLNATCSDATSGCGQMRFSNDNATWSTPATFATTTAWNLASGYGGTATDGSKTVYVQFRDAAGGAWSTSFSDSIFLDNHVPSTTATPAGAGNQTNSVGVTLSCNDDTAGTGSGCSETYYTTDGITPTASSSLYSGGTITIDGSTSPMYLKFFSVDTLGNTEPVRTETYTFVAATTQLSILLSTQTIMQTGSVDVSGSLSEYSTADINLLGLPISLTVSGPSGTVTYTTTTDSVNGHYIFRDITGFSQKGTYGIRARFGGTGLLQAANSSTQALLVGNSAGYAVIVEGKVPNDEGLSSHNKTANRIYQNLLDRGFAATNIFYYNYNTGQPGVAGAPSKAVVQAVFTGTGPDDLLTKMNNVPAPLWVILVDHGSPEKFYLDAEWISPQDLDQWLDTLEAGLNVPALLEKRFVVIGACYSGSFIPALSLAPTSANGGRIIITSAAAGEESYKGPQEPDGIRSGEFFLEELFKELAKGTGITAAFEVAAENTRAFTSQGGGDANTVNAYGDSSVQHPLLDDNGDGSGSNSLSDANGDGVAAQSDYLGVGLTNSAANPADLVAVTETRYLDSSTSQALLWAKPDVYSYVDTAWVEVKAPTTQLAGTGGTGQLELNIPRVFIDPNDAAGQWQYVYGTDCAGEGCFGTPGRYDVYYFTRNMYTEEVSQLKRSTVYKDKAGNAAPTMPALVSPPTGTTTKTSVFFQWNASTDPNGDSLTYTMEISLTSNFTGTNVVYRQEELQDTWHFAGQDAGLLDQTSYYWRVTAVDRYGAHASSAIRSFSTNNTNLTLPAVVSGIVTDNLSGAPLAGATVTFSTAVTKTTDSQGKYVLSLSSGQSMTVSAAKAGYTSSTAYTITAVEGQETTQDIKLNPTNPTTYSLAVSKTGTGTGTVVSSPAGITCGSTCSGNYNAGQVITLTASPGNGGSFGGWSGSGCSGTGTCIVTLNSAATVTATFTAPSYTVTPSAGPNGSISPPTARLVTANTTTSFTVTPGSGYHIASVTGCGGSLSGSTYTTGPVTADCTVSAVFSVNTYTVTPSAGANGGISPSTAQAVNYGATTAFVVTPNTGYHIASVTGCGGSLSGSLYTTGTVTGSCTVSAVFSVNTYTVTPSAGANGSISPSTPRLVSYNTTTSFTVTPATGYHVGSVSGCGGSLSGSTYTTGPVTGDCSVSAAFAVDTFTVTPSAGPNGGISPNTGQTVNYNGTASFTVTPGSGYHIASVTGCGGSLSGSTYTTGPVTADCAVSALFTINTYTVTPSAGANGSISPNTAQTVNGGGTTNFLVTPNTGYHIASVTGCGGSLSGSLYTTGTVTGSCTVSAVFSVNTYTVTPSAGANGSISPSTPRLVSYNTATSFTVTPAAGYHMGSVSGCGGSLAGNIYTIAPATADCTVSASFVNTAPTTPTLNAPLSGTEAASLTPMLKVNAATDADGDSLTYAYEVYADSGLTNPVVNAAGQGTSWTVPVSLADNTTYYWRAQAFDAVAGSAWMSTANFFVNTANDTPTTPAVSAPANGTQVTTRTPALTVTNAADADHDLLTYDFEVATDSGFLNVIAGASGRPEGSGTTAWTVPYSLADNSSFFWRARSVDGHGAAGSWASAAFTVNTANDAPTAPAISSPADGSETATLSPSLTVTNAADAENDVLHYLFEIDTTPSFNSGAKRTSGPVAEGAGSTSWTPPALLDNTRYYWRTKANDGLADGPWASASLFVNLANEAPTAPTLNNPANASTVTVLAPTLSVNAAADPDQDALAYDFEVYGDSGLTALVTGISGTGTSWVVAPSLADNTSYWWRSRAGDTHGLAGPWMTAAAFFVNNNGVNDPPIISITAPGAGGDVTNASTYTIRWTDADPDSNAVIALAFDTVGSGYTGTAIAAGISEDDAANAYAWNISGLQEGAYYIYATITDGTTTNRTYAPGALVINRSTPIATISGAPAGPTRQTGATLTVGGPVVSYKYRLDSGPQSAETSTLNPIVLTGLAEGSHTVEVLGKNSGDVWQVTPTTATWTVDTTPPDTTLTGQPLHPSHTASATFTFASEPGVAFECSLDGGNLASCSSPKSHTGLAEGGHTFQVQATDPAGNTDPTPVVFGWSVDTLRTVTPSAGPNGSISPATPQVITYNSTKAFTVATSAGYHIASVSGCGGSLTGSTYTTAAVTTDCTVLALFSANTYTVTPGAGANGSITPAQPQAVNHGATAGFVVTPSTGYHIASVSGCGGSLNGSTYTTGQITGDCSVSALFSVNTYTVTPGAGANGSITPAQPQAVNHGATTSFAVTPNTGYHIASVSGCGGTLSGSTYTIAPAAADCTVNATFAIDTFTVTPSAGSGGSISLPTPQTVSRNGTVSLLITPATGYHINSVSGCGGTLSGNVFTTGPVTANCTVNATFAVDTFTVTPSAGSGGSIAPGTAQTVNYSGTTSFTITPNGGYQIDAVSGCGGSLAGSVYTTGAITRNCTVTASFTPIVTVPDGILTGGTSPSIADALRALRIAAGLIAPTATDRAHGDVAPLVNGVPQPDGKIDINDAIVILRKSVGLVNW